MEKKLSKIQAEAKRQFGRELNEKELESFLNMKVMEAAFENIDSEHPHDKESSSSKVEKSSDSKN